MHIRTESERMTNYCLDLVKQRIIKMQFQTSVVSTENFSFLWLKNVTLSETQEHGSEVKSRGPVTILLELQMCHFLALEFHIFPRTFIHCKVLLRDIYILLNPSLINTAFKQHQNILFHLTLYDWHHKLFLPLSFHNSYLFNYSLK